MQILIPALQTLSLMKHASKNSNNKKPKYRTQARDAVGYSAGQ